MRSPAGKRRALTALAAAGSDRFAVDPFLIVGWDEWRTSRERVLGAIARRWPDGDLLAIRSSSLQEELRPAAVAGKYETRLGVRADSPARLEEAIDAVFSSYGEVKSSAPIPGPAGDVLVQLQVTEIDIAGAMTTRDADNRPYFVVEFDRRGTTAVTAGLSHTRVRVAHGAVQIPRGYRTLISAAAEITSILGEEDLVIEFALDRSGVVHVFQAWARERQPPRVPDPVAAERLRRAEGDVHRFLDRGPTALSDMADWNPAEILGPQPATLDVSLYELLITDDVWSRARASLGYHDVGPRPLLRQVGGKPYVDVALSFASLTPKALPASLRERLLADRLACLAENPALHDKVEFEVLTTVVRLAGEEELRGRLGPDFSEREVAQIDAALRGLTAAALIDGRSLLDASRQAAHALWSGRQNGGQRTETQQISDLSADLVRRLGLCRELGTLPFARVARLAFMLRDLLGQLASMDAIERGWLDRLYASVATPASTLTGALAAVRSGGSRPADLAKLFGHLRPRTYDVTSSRYVDDLDALLDSPTVGQASFDGGNRALGFRAEEADAVLRKAGLPAAHFFELCRNAITEREWVKFSFSAVVSDLLEDLAWLGNRLGLEREQIRHLTFGELISAGQSPIPRADELRKRAEHRRERHDSGIFHPHLIFGPGDLYVIEEPEPLPTYVTQERIVGPICRVESRRPTVAVKDAIVLVEAADPGYDWIFAAGIQGLITRYGGSASHMAIRCEELGVPAAIGVGDLLFETLAAARIVDLDCLRRAVTVVEGLDDSLVPRHPAIR
ncbi:MAG TPA: PEP-utilizing enzyme [Solirubrobacterales bacterium]